jgi:hypothetical protein
VDPATAQIIGEEIDRSLKDSWNDGYKTARVEYEPQVDYWKALDEQDRQEKALVWSNGFWIGAGTGTVVTIGLIAGATWLLGAVSR